MPSKKAIEVRFENFERPFQNKKTEVTKSVNQENEPYRETEATESARQAVGQMRNTS